MRASRRLADAAQGDEAPLQALFGDARSLPAWLERWRTRCAEDDETAQSEGASSSGARELSSAGERAARRRRVNPLVIPRNHRVEEALAAASSADDLGPFERLLEALRRPYDEAPEQLRYAEPAPAAMTAAYRTFCGT